MRQRRGFGFLGIVGAIAIAAGLIAGGAGRAQADPFSTCAPAGVGSVTCTMTTSTAVAAGGTMTKTITSPPGAMITSTTTIAGCPASAVPAASVTYACVAPAGIALSFPITQTFSIPAGPPAPITETVIYNANGPVPASPLATTHGGSCGALAAVVGATATCTDTTNATVVAPLSLTFKVSSVATTLSITAAPATAGSCPLATGLPTATSASETITYACSGAESVPSGTPISMTIKNGLAVGATPAELTTMNVGGTGATAIPAPTTQSLTSSGVPGGFNSPNAEAMTCTNLASGASTPLTLNLFGTAVCTATLSSLGGSPVADGTVIVKLVSSGGPTNNAVLSCATGACSVVGAGQEVDLPCGTTAPSGATPSVTCTSVNFNVQSATAACVSSPVTCPTGAQLTGNTTATVQVSFVPTPGNAGGTVVLGTNTFTFTAPGTSTLLVTATPQLIPSNGTLASVVTATFACASGYSTLGGIPLSGGGSGSPSPVLGTGDTALCGAGLPGTFTFSGNNRALFDNGRSTESVPCGLPAQDNIFGVGGNGFGTGTSPTSPLVFTCTGAAVLVIGNGAAGDAPLNVSYQSQVGGLSAIGSTLITVAPSGTPKLALACNPGTINAGSTGSLCTATVTDQNGIPLTGITGATVTFTVSDPAAATIAPCIVGIGGVINTTTSPNVTPLLSASAPCLPPSGTIPGQANTFVNGQTTAVVVASSTAHPETLTVKASLGVLVPPSYACMVAPYLPAGFPAGGVGLPSVVGCGSANPVGFSGLASALSTADAGLTGVVTMPNVTFVTANVTIGGAGGVQVAGGTATTPLQLTRGCSQTVITSTQGTPMSTIAGLISPQSAVTAIWRFSNATKQYQGGFFADQAAPTDFSTTGGVDPTSGQVDQPAAGQVNNQISESYFVCVTGAATMTSS